MGKGTMSKRVQISAVRSDVDDQSDLLAIHELAQAQDVSDVSRVISSRKTSLQSVRDHATLNDLRKIAQRVEADGGKNLELLTEYVSKFYEAEQIEAVANGKLLEDVVVPADKRHVIKVRNTLIKEYGAGKLSELMVIDMAVEAYFRLMSASKELNMARNTHNVTQVNINLLKTLDRSLELANKQFLSCLTYLVDSKRVPVNIRLSGPTYVGGNQQINNNT